MRAKSSHSRIEPKYERMAGWHVNPRCSSCASVSAYLGFGLSYTAARKGRDKMVQRLTRRVIFKSFSCWCDRMDADDTVWWYRLERLCLGMKRKR